MTENLCKDCLYHDRSDYDIIHNSPTIICGCHLNLIKFSDYLEKQHKIRCLEIDESSEHTTCKHFSSIVW